jgi:hypothetical protein
VDIALKADRKPRKKAAGKRKKRADDSTPDGAGTGSSAMPRSVS